MKTIMVRQSSLSSRQRMAVASLTLLAAAFLPAAPCQAYNNPVFDHDRPDPSVLYHNGDTWMMHTMGGPPGWPILKGSNLTGSWTFQGHMVTTNNQAPWMKGPYWAPELHRVQSQKDAIPLFETETFKFVIPFTSKRVSDGKYCVGIAESDSITGPYTTPDAPLVVDAIDSHIFQDYDGRKYFLWRTWWGVHPELRIYGRELNADCTGFAPGSSAVELIRVSQNWEAATVEGPWLYRRGNYYYLLYSGNECCAEPNSTEYAVGVARATSPLGPYTKYSGNPILKKNGTFDGTGHGAVIRDNNATDWHYYHAYHAGDHSQGRVQMLDKITYTNDWPTFGNGGTPSTTQQSDPVFSPDNPPACYVAAPGDGATISGNAVLSAGASDDGDVLEVVFYRWGPWATQVRIGNAKPSPYGWIVSWDTTTMADGSYDIFAVATDTNGHFTYSSSIEVTIDN